MELGRVNVIIGANGSGKTNILEGIAMGAAAAARKLDSETLGTRIRVTDPRFMSSGFSSNSGEKISIDISIDEPNQSFDFLLAPKEQIEFAWFDEKWVFFNREVRNYEITRELNLGKKGLNLEKWANLLTKFDLQIKEGESDDLHQRRIRELIQTEKEVQNQFESFGEFLIYSPENSFLRKFEEPAQLYPLGIRGEGLFHELKRIFTDKKKKKQQNEIVEHLHLLDWFEDLEIPKGLMSMEYKIAIKDRFLDPKLAAFDQRSANEGFLMLLFYLVLFTSENTPKFFAIENIENAFNPKMCRELMTLFTKLAVKYDKQFIVTTHNSSTLNGLDLRDDEQRLFVARRTSKGETWADRIVQKPKEGIMLSEIWTRGYFGGLPDNF